MAVATLPDKMLQIRTVVCVLCFSEFMARYNMAPQTVVAIMNTICAQLRFRLRKTGRYPEKEQLN